MHHVLFICTGNSARSILAEGLLNALGGGRWSACSAGSHPKAAVHPLALTTLQEMGISIDGLRSKGWEEFARPGAPSMDLIVTVCDQAAGEACPFWPGQPVSAHWGLPDPAAFAGSEAAKARVFRDTALALKRRIELLLSLPIATLDRRDLQGAVAAIGAQ